MELQALKKLVLEGNKELPKQNLVKYSWGNVSQIDRQNRVIVIKPVGMPYDELTCGNVSVVDSRETCWKDRSNLRLIWISTGAL